MKNIERETGARRDEQRRRQTERTTENVEKKRERYREPNVQKDKERHRETMIEYYTHPPTPSPVTNTCLHRTGKSIHTGESTPSTRGTRETIGHPYPLLLFPLSGYERRRDVTLRQLSRKSLMSWTVMSDRSSRP